MSIHICFLLFFFDGVQLYTYASMYGITRILYMNVIKDLEINASIYMKPICMQVSILRCK